MRAYPHLFPEYKIQTLPDKTDLLFLFLHAVKALNIFNSYRGGLIEWFSPLNQDDFYNVDKARAFVGAFPYSNCQAYLMIFDSLLLGSSVVPVMPFDLLWAYNVIGNAINNDSHLKLIQGAEENFDGNLQADWA